MRMLEIYAGSGKLAKTFASHGWEADTVELKDGQDALTWEPARRYDFFCCPNLAVGLLAIAEEMRKMQP